MLSEQTYDRIKNMIYNGRLRPGQRLVERDLSRQFTISRIPLRESLIRLESEGLVRKVANAAQFVEDFSQEDLLEIYSMRLILEPLAARLAALRSTRALIRRLHKLCERMTNSTAAGEWAKLDAADYKFHRAIVDASRHRRLIRAYECSHIQITGRQADYHQLKNLPADTTAREHLRIIEAIEMADGEKAWQLTYQHVWNAMQTLNGCLGIRADQLRELAQGRPAASTNNADRRGQDA